MVRRAEENAGETLPTCWYWYMVYGIWCTVYGLRCTVCGGNGNAAHTLEILSKLIGAKNFWLGFFKPKSIYLEGFKKKKINVSLSVDSVLLHAKPIIMIKSIS